jgi:Zn-finger nucleic acid-binding protein
MLLAFAGLEVDICERCGGVWLDAGELAAILTRGGASADDPILRSLSKAAYRFGGTTLCPRCDAGMVEVRVGDLVLDRCPEGHGAWLDRGELERLLRESSGGSAAVLAEVLGRRATGR